MRTRFVQSTLTALIIAVGVGLALTVVVLGAAIDRGLRTAGGPFYVVVGPKGSATQLVMSSVLLQDVPLGNISYAQYADVRAHAGVQHAVPIGLGDNVAGLRLVGTTPEFFEVAIAPDRPPFYNIATGRRFDQDFEAVLGSTAAQQLGFGVGAAFNSSHGVIGGVAGAGHTQSYTVVGVLAPTNTPADLGIYVPLSSYWKVHAPEIKSSIFAPDQIAAEITALPEDQRAELGVTAVLVRGTTISANYQIYQDINSGEQLQAALPGTVLTQFLDWLGQGQRVLAAITYVALGMAAISMALALYGAVQARRRDIAVLRALGASRATVLQVALWEALVLGGIGLALGWLLAHGVAAEVADQIAHQSAIAVQPHGEISEAWLILGSLALGVLAGLLPALQAYRVQPAAVLAGQG